MSGKEVLLLLFLYRLIVSLHVGNLLLQLAHLLFLQYLFVFDRYYLDKLVDECVQSSSMTRASFEPVYR